MNRSKLANWQEFFDAHAPYYMQNGFTAKTVAEVDFIVEHLAIPQHGRVLDVGCGTGRHSVELAKRGFRVTGIDLSTGMLAEARKAASTACVVVELLQRDATDFTFPAQFDAAICVCEGAFGLLGAQDDPVGRDVRILRNIHASLKSAAGFLLTALNGCRAIREMGTDHGDGGFDPLTMTTIAQIPVKTLTGEQISTTRERCFTPTELVLMCRVAGFEVQRVSGGTAGNWRLEGFDPDEMELMVLAVKS